MQALAMKKRDGVADRQLLMEIYEHHSPGIYRYPYRMLDAKDLAEDCVADTFLRLLIADALVDLGAVTRDSGAESEARQYLLEALRTAIETQTNHMAVQVLVEIAVMEMGEGHKELALELVTFCLQHPSTKREVTDHAELVAQLSPQQIEIAEARTKAATLESLAQETLAAG